LRSQGVPLSTQTPSRIDTEPFALFLRAHAAVVRELSAELEAEHGLTINDYEVLLRLARAPDRLMRRVDLAQQVVLTPSGITRLLEGLERAGYVDRAVCASDARVKYAHLTDAGHDKLRAAAKTHVAGIERLFLGRFDESERAQLSEFLRRLGESGGDCAPE
jgi:DNA-binding MarR family transcriptional regulator